MMASSVVLNHVARSKSGFKIVVREMTLGSYVLGGIPVTAADFGLKTVYGAHCTMITSPSPRVKVASYSPATGKIKCIITNAEPTNGADLSGTKIQVIAFGI